MKLVMLEIYISSLLYLIDLLPFRFRLFMDLLFGLEWIVDPEIRAFVKDHALFIVGTPSQ